MYFLVMSFIIYIKYSVNKINIYFTHIDKLMGKTWKTSKKLYPSQIQKKLNEEKRAKEEEARKEAKLEKEWSAGNSTHVSKTERDRMKEEERLRRKIEREKIEEEELREILKK